MPARPAHHPAARLRPLAIVAVATALILGGCSNGAGTPPKAGVPQAEVLKSLRCDRTRPGRYMGGPAARFERDRARDCYRDGDFVARVHLLTSVAFTEESVQALNGDRYGPPYPDHLDAGCRRAPVLVRGRDWIAVTLDRSAARQVQRLVGGAIVPPPPGKGPLVSYDLPCGTE
jgi:hypothetical protein